jgi:hypothetical protein
LRSWRFGITQLWDATAVAASQTCLNRLSAVQMLFNEIKNIDYLTAATEIRASAHASVNRDIKLHLHVIARDYEALAQVIASMESDADVRPVSVSQPTPP